MTKVAGNGYSPLLRSPRLPPTLPFLLFFQTLCVSAFISPAKKFGCFAAVRNRDRIFA